MRHVKKIIKKYVGFYNSQNFQNIGSFNEISHQPGFYMLRNGYQTEF